MKSRFKISIILNIVTIILSLILIGLVIFGNFENSNQINLILSIILILSSSFRLYFTSKERKEKEEHID